MKPKRNSCNWQNLYY